VSLKKPPETMNKPLLSDIIEDLTAEQAGLRDLANEVRELVDFITEID